MICRHCPRGRQCKNIEDNFPHHNWFMSIFLLLSIGYVGHIMFTPSIYQFITTPRTPVSTNDENSDRFWPGLGGSDRDYAWTLISFALMEAGSLPFVTAMMNSAPFTVSLIVLMSLYAVSGTIYACATDVWMVILSRSVMGVASLTLSGFIYTYVGEVGTLMDQIRQKKNKKPRKHALYMMVLFGTGLANFALLGIYAAITSAIPSTDPYRWPGWFQVVLNATSIIIVILFFTETRPWTCNWKRKTKCSLSGFFLSLKLRSINKCQIMLQLFVFLCVYVNGQLWALISTLVTPVLSHQFGFNVVQTSLFLMGVPVAYLAVFFLVLAGEKLLKGNNRVMVALSFIISLCGCALMSDWQAIGGNPCSFNNQTIINDTTTIEAFYRTDLDVYESDNITEFQKCEARSTSSYECFWNPQSRVTGEYCNTCLQTCLSHQTSLDFYQFNVGVFLTAMGSSLGFVFINALNSDVTPSQYQGATTSIVVASNALARAVSPLWFVESYDLTGRHTYLPMSIIIGSILILLVGLVILYHRLSPRPLSEGKPQPVTNPTSTVVEDHHQSSEIPVDL